METPNEPAKTPVIVVEHGPHRGIYIRQQDARDQSAVERLTVGLVSTENPARRTAKTLLEMLAGRMRNLENSGKYSLEVGKGSIITVADDNTWAFALGLVIVEQATRIDL